MKRFLFFLCAFIFSLCTFSSTFAGHFFVGAGGGADFPYFTQNNQLMITRNAAAHSDLLSTHALSTDGYFSADLGYQFRVTDAQWINLFFEYDQFGNRTVNGTRYDIYTAGPVPPELINAFSFQLRRRAFLFGLKGDLFKWHDVLPYVEAGVGVAQNQFLNFSNSDLSNLAMNNLPNNTNTNACYVVGAGLDWLPIPNWMLSAGYRFGYWGQVKSGVQTQALSGAGPLPTPIQWISKFYSNQALLKVTYLFN